MVEGSTHDYEKVVVQEIQMTRPRLSERPRSIPIVCSRVVDIDGTRDERGLIATCSWPPVIYMRPFFTVAECRKRPGGMFSCCCHVSVAGVYTNVEKVHDIFNVLPPKT
jgi:hypothetical protein